MTTILSVNGLLEIPEAFRRADDLKPGQTCEIERLGNGEYRRELASGCKSEQESNGPLDCGTEA